MTLPSAVKIDVGSRGSNCRRFLVAHKCLIKANYDLLPACNGRMGRDFAVKVCVVVRSLDGAELVR